MGGNLRFVQAIDDPFTLRASAHAFVKADRRFVPVQDGPFEAAAAARVGDAKKFGEQSFANAPSAQVRVHKKVLEIETGLREKGGEVEKIDSESGGRTIEEREQDLRVF